MKSFSISKKILVLFVSLSLVSLVSCTTTKTTDANVTTPVVETKTEEPAVEIVTDVQAPVVEKVVTETTSVVVEQKTDMMDETKAIVMETPVVEATPCTVETPVKVQAPAMQYPLEITPIVKSDAKYPVFDLFVVHTNDVEGKV
ncbi:MAG: hypothetical protein JJE21_10255, partial [Spirochaetaceae bacterium]|nr:hypothetical protein [Spirochaetaceae bacterium]